MPPATDSGSLLIDVATLTVRFFTLAVPTRNRAANAAVLRSSTDRPLFVVSFTWSSARQLVGVSFTRSPRRIVTAWETNRVGPPFLDTLVSVNVARVVAPLWA